MKLTVAGKGGSGKSAVTALIARVLGERGWMTLAVDLDANPGLAIAFGLDPVDAPLPDEAVEQRQDATYGWTMAAHLTATEMVGRYGTPVGDRIVYLGFGNTATLAATSVTRYVTAVRHVASDFHEPGWAVIGDLEAGTTKPFEGYARFASPALVLVEPTVASILTAQRLLEILAHDGTPAEVVLNKARTQADVDMVTRDLRLLGTIPYDPDLHHLADDGHLGTLADSTPALAAVRGIVTTLETAEAANADAGREAWIGSGPGGAVAASVGGFEEFGVAQSRWWLNGNHRSGSPT